MRKTTVRIGLIAAAVSVAMTVQSTAYAASAVTGPTAESVANTVERVTGTEQVEAVTPAADGGATAVTSAGLVDIPVKTTGDVTVYDESGATAVAIGLPDTTSKQAVATDDGTVVYADARQPADIAVQAVDTGVRMLVTIKNADADREYRFPVEVPEGARLVTAADLLGADWDTGEAFVISAEGELLSAFAPAWAKDANGASVPTHYRVEGSTLVQVVDFTADSAFPIVADPDWWKITKCAGAITWFIGSNIVVVSKLIKIKNYIKALGGVRESAELMLKASTWEERLRLGGGALVGLVAEVMGVVSIRDNCFK